MTKLQYGYLNQEILCQATDQKYVPVPKYTTLVITPSHGEMLSCLALFNSTIQPLQVLREAVTRLQPEIETQDLKTTLEQLAQKARNRLV